MFKKSLRLRIVATFIGIVLVSLILSFMINNGSQEKTPNRLMITFAEDLATLINLIDDPEKVKSSFDIFARYGLNITPVNAQSDVLSALPEDKAHSLFEKGTTDAMFISSKDGIATIGVPGTEEGIGTFLIQSDFSSLFTHCETRS
ncbi:hypothetical protein P9222_24395 [Paenibacillus amylolyticus]|nr:hypothetical protein [Paenibacillus amylolyticus]WFR61533.1 hypothetical protein P9222_24395 [Paenibacillus amylolyticus]